MFYTIVAVAGMTLPRGDGDLESFGVVSLEMLLPPESSGAFSEVHMRLVCKHIDRHSDIVPNHPKCLAMCCRSSPGCSDELSLMYVCIFVCMVLHTCMHAWYSGRLMYVYVLLQLTRYLCRTVT